MGLRLFRQAQADFASGERNVRPGDYHVAVYLAHQAAEKALKAAIWYLRAEEPPWTHDLRTSAARLADVAGPLPDSVEQAIVALSPLYYETRYPSGDDEEPVPADLVGEGLSAGYTGGEGGSQVGRGAAARTAWASPDGEPLLREFARLMDQRYGARLYVFGSRVRGQTARDSDYDLAAVSDEFGRQPRFERAPDQWRLWSEAGGWGVPLDLHCYTPEEFRRHLQGLGYLGQANRRGELVEVAPSARPERGRGVSQYPANDSSG